MISTGRWFWSMVFMGLAALFVFGAVNMSIEAAHEQERFAFVGDCFMALVEMFASLFVVFLSWCCACIDLDAERIEGER